MWIHCHEVRKHVHLHCTPTDTTSYSVVNTLVAALPSGNGRYLLLGECGVTCQVLLCAQTTDLRIYWKSRFLDNLFLNSAFGVYLCGTHYSVKKQNEELLSLPPHPTPLFMSQQYHRQCFNCCQNLWLLIKCTFQMKKCTFWRLLYLERFSGLF